MWYMAPMPKLRTAHVAIHHAFSNSLLTTPLFAPHPLSRQSHLPVQLQSEGAVLVVLELGLETGDDVLEGLVLLLDSLLDLLLAILELGSALVPDVGLAAGPLADDLVSEVNNISHHLRTFSTYALVGLGETAKGSHVRAQNVEVRRQLLVLGVRGFQLQGDTGVTLVTRLVVKAKLGVLLANLTELTLDLGLTSGRHDVELGERSVIYLRVVVTISESMRYSLLDV